MSGSGWRGMRWVYIKKGGSVRDLRDGETVLYLDCDGGGHKVDYICRNLQNGTVKRVQFTIDKLCFN